MSVKKISGYTIFLKDVLGKGSYGCVYKGQKDQTGEICAIKMLSKKNIDSDQYLKNALFNQINVLKSVKSVNVVGFFDVMQSSQNYYIIQQLCDNDLEKLINSKGGKIPQQQAINLLKQMCNGLLGLVREGIVHRDLKPANVLLSKGVVKIGDFGFAKKNPNQRVRNATAVGTPLYMCIQILKGQPYTSKCDIWALGFIFYEMLHGYTPWTANTQFELVKNLENKPLKINNNLSVNTKDFLEKTLRVKENDRIGWDQVFMHKIFNGFFQQENGNFQNKLKKFMSDLRFMVNSQNIDLKNLFERFGYKEDHLLKFKQFQQIIRCVNPQIKSEEEVYVFQILDKDDSNSISLKQLSQQMEKNNISLRSKYKQNVPIPSNLRANSINTNEQSFNHEKNNQMNENLFKKIRECFLRLNKILVLKNETLYHTYCMYDSDKSGNLGLEQFTKFIRRLDGSISEEQLQIVFNFIDSDKSKAISFQELNRHYCKVNGIPQSLQLPPELYFMMIHQKTNYYQQMKENNGSEFVMDKLKQAYSTNKT